MKRTTRIAAAAALSLLAAPALAQWTLVWADEFDGPTLDTGNWETMLGTGSQYGLNGWGNNELQYYTARPENIQFSDGMLHIIARKENYQGSQYTSARLRSRNKADFTYGRFEARIKVPKGQGLWSAFWMLPTNSPYGGWAASGEIDIMECINQSDTLHGTIHHWSNWPNNRSVGGESHAFSDWAADFHVYAIEWEPDEIRWYFDDTHYLTIRKEQWGSTAAPQSETAPFDVDFHMLLNFAVGGDWPGSPNASTPFPSEMIVDYVRVYTESPPGPCNPADISPEYGVLDFYDVSTFLVVFQLQDPTADLDSNGVFDFFDVSAFLSAFNDGCP